MSMANKYKILQKLSLYADEPDRISETFEFRRFAEQLADLLLEENLHTPYSIAIDGEWGSGKTSLIGQVFDNLKNKIPNDQWKIVWFDAWEYENIDPMLALMQNIALQYQTKSSKIKDVINGFLLVSADVILRSQIGLSIEEIQQRFEGIVKDIPTIKKELEQIIGENGRLIVFIDDLDRCSIDNILKILEAVKLFFNAKGSIFVFAVDIKKIERAWELRYSNINIMTSLQEGKDHIDKIFQLKLSLPPKESKEIRAYIYKLAESLPENIADLVINGCPSNPRKIKRILNLVYFLAKGTDAVSFDKQFPLLVIWSIATVAYPDLARLVKMSPKSLVQMALIVHHLQHFENLVRLNFEDTKESVFKFSGLKMPKEMLFPSTISGLKYVTNNPQAFPFLKGIASYYKIWVNNEMAQNLEPTLEKGYDTIVSELDHIIYRGGLVA